MTENHPNGHITVRINGKYVISKIETKCQAPTLLNRAPTSVDLYEDDVKHTTQSITQGYEVTTNISYSDTLDTHKMVVKGDGNVGIGTDNPDVNLHVYNSSNHIKDRTIRWLSINS